jgi:hypothetical protein
VTGESAAAVRAERGADAGGESVLLHLAVRGGFADAEHLRSGRNASSGDSERFFERRFFQFVEVEGFWEGK